MLVRTRRSDSPGNVKPDPLETRHYTFANRPHSDKQNQPLIPRQPTQSVEDGSKGILVTTSGYGKASFEFANGKPIELISGSGLLYLLREHAGVDAKIEPPEDWRDFQDRSQ
jgi:restriction endonuclease Mrr